MQPYALDIIQASRSAWDKKKNMGASFPPSMLSGSSGSTVGILVRGMRAWGAAKTQVVLTLFA